MAQGPILIFDKSSLEGLNLDEAVLLDNFYMTARLVALWNTGATKLKSVSPVRTIPIRFD
jgi:hypothetical protein